MRIPINLYLLTLLLIFLTSVDIGLFEGVSLMPSIRLPELVTWPLILLYLGRFGTEPRAVRAEVGSFYRHNRLFCLYVGWAGIAALAGAIFRGKFEVFWMFREMMPAVVLYFAIVTYVTNERLYQVMTVFMAGISVNVALGLLQIIFDSPRIVPLGEGVDAKMDIGGNFVSKVATGVFHHPNGLALLLLPPALLCIVRLVSGNVFHKHVPRLLVAGMLVLLLFVLAWTFAKGVFVWALVGSALIISFRFIHRRFLFFGLFVLVSTIIGITLYAATHALEYHVFGTILTRILLWAAAAVVMTQDFYVDFFGDGFSGMESASAIIASWEYPNAHNAIINQALFYGLPAMILYVAFFCSVLKKASTAMSEDSGSGKGLLLFLFVTLIALFGESFFEPSNSGITFQAHFFILAAMAQVAAREACRTHPFAAESEAYA